MPCSFTCCRRSAQEAEPEEEQPLTRVLMTASRQKVHLTDKCPSLKVSTVYVRETQEVCKHCRRLVLEEILDQKKKTR